MSYATTHSQTLILTPRHWWRPQ